MNVKEFKCEATANSFVECCTMTKDGIKVNVNQIEEITSFMKTRLLENVKLKEMILLIIIRLLFMDI